jgi:hypothetical protein
MRVRQPRALPRARPAAARDILQPPPLERARPRRMGRSNPMRTGASLAIAKSAERSCPCRSITSSYFAARISRISRSTLATAPSAAPFSRNRAGRRAGYSRPRDAPGRAGHSPASAANRSARAGSAAAVSRAPAAYGPHRPTAEGLMSRMRENMSHYLPGAPDAAAAHRAPRARRCRSR